MAPASKPGPQIAGHPAGSAAPAPRWHRTFPGDARELGQLRRWLTTLLPDCPARHDIAVVATELAANAITHTASGQRGWFAVDIIRYPALVRVAVTDLGAPHGPRVICDPAGEHGRGLRLVTGLSVRTGVRGDRRGRSVWADVPWDNALPWPPQDGNETRDSCQVMELARRSGIPAWYGRATSQWWALAGEELLAASSPGELATLISQATDQPPWQPASRRRRFDC